MANRKLTKLNKLTKAQQEVADQITDIFEVGFQRDYPRVTLFRDRTGHCIFFRTNQTKTLVACVYQRQVQIIKGTLYQYIFEDFAHKTNRETVIVDEFVIEGELRTARYVDWHIKQLPGARQDPDSEGGIFDSLWTMEDPTLGSVRTQTVYGSAATSQSTYWVSGSDLMDEGVE